MRTSVPTRGIVCLSCLKLTLCALGCNDRYQLSFEDRTDLGLVMSGAALMDHGLNVTRMDGAEASEVVWLEELATDLLLAKSASAESK